MPNEYELDINKLTVQNKLLNQRFNYYMGNNIPDAQNIIFQITPGYSPPRKASTQQLDVSGGSLLHKALLILGIITGIPVTMKTLPEVLSKIKTGDIDVGIKNAPDFFKTYLQAKIENKEKYLNKKLNYNFDKWAKDFLKEVNNFPPKFKIPLQKTINDIKTVRTFINNLSDTQLKSVSETIDYNKLINLDSVSSDERFEQFTNIYDKFLNNKWFINYIDPELYAKLNQSGLLPDLLDKLDEMTISDIINIYGEDTTGNKYEEAMKRYALKINEDIADLIFNAESGE